MEMTLTQAIQSAFSGVPDRVLGSTPIVFTLPAKNGGRGAVEVNVKGYGDRWSKGQKEYDLRFLRVQVVRNSHLKNGVDLEFGLCPFEDGGKVGRRIAPLEVLEHVTTEEIIGKLKAMIEATGDLRFDPGVRKPGSFDDEI